MSSIQIEIEMQIPPKQKKYNYGCAQSKIPLHNWDDINLKQAFDKTSMQIFHINQIRLLQIQSQINSSKFRTRTRAKEVIVQIYSIFQDMNLIFRRLGILELFEQLRLMLNIVSTFGFCNQFRNNDTSNNKKTQEKSHQISQSKSQIKQPCPSTNSLIHKSLIANRNKMRGIFLYNESYIKTVQKNLDKSKPQKHNDIKQLLQPEDLSDELQRQQMIYYLQRKKQLTVLKIKDHSKKYKEIEQEFKMVEEKLKFMVENLELQFQNQSIKNYQYLTKEQINNELVNFNVNMRSQLVVIKEQYSTAAESLRQQNMEIKNKLNEELARRNGMVHAQVQTIQTVASIKKIKRLAQQYQTKIKKMDIKLQAAIKKQMQLQQKLEEFSIKKQRQIANIYENIYKKDEQIANLKKKCQNFELMIKQQNNNILQNFKSLTEDDKQIIMQQLKKSINTDLQMEIHERKFDQRESLGNKLSSIKKNSFRSISRYSRFSIASSQLDKILEGIDNQNLDIQFKEQVLRDQIIQKKLSLLQHMRNNSESKNMKRNGLKNLNSVPERPNPKNKQQHDNEQNNKTCNLNFNINSENSQQGVKIMSQTIGNGVCSPNTLNLLIKLGKRDLIQAQIANQNKDKQRKTDKNSNISNQLASRKHQNSTNCQTKQLNEISSNNMVKDMKNNRQSVNKGHEGLSLLNQNEKPIKDKRYSHITKEVSKNIQSVQRCRLQKLNTSNNTGSLHEQMDLQKIKGKMNNIFEQINNSNSNSNSNQNNQNILAIKNKKPSTGKASSFHTKTLKNFRKNHEEQQGNKLQLGKDGKENTNWVVKNEQKMKEQVLAKFSELLSQNLFKSSKMTYKQIQQILQKYPELAELLEFQMLSRVSIENQQNGKNCTAQQLLFAKFKDFHQRKCKERVCNHLEHFMRFCKKYVQMLKNNKRQALKLYVQNFQNV